MTPLLVGVLHRLADVEEERQPRVDVEPVRVAVRRDGTPSTSSMTKYGRPSAVAPASKTRAMFG